MAWYLIRQHHFRADLTHNTAACPLIDILNNDITAALRYLPSEPQDGPRDRASFPRRDSMWRCAGTSQATTKICFRSKHVDPDVMTERRRVIGENWPCTLGVIIEFTFTAFSLQREPWSCRRHGRVHQREARELMQHQPGQRVTRPLLGKDRHTAAHLERSLERAAGSRCSTEANRSELLLPTIEF